MPKKQTNRRVAEIFYRDGGNYKNRFLIELPRDCKVKVSEDVEVTELGITVEDWEENFCFQLHGGYDDELDHTSVSVTEIRPMTLADEDKLNKVIR